MLEDSASWLQSFSFESQGIRRFCFGQVFALPCGMLEKAVRIATIFSLLCLGWLIPGIFAPPRCSKSSLVQSFDISDALAQSRVWNCSVDSTGESLALDHQHRVRDLEDKIHKLELVVTWYGLPRHLFNPKFQITKSDAELETDLVSSYLKAQPELQSQTHTLLPQLTLFAFGRLELKKDSWAPLPLTLQDAKMLNQVENELTLSFDDRLRTDRFRNPRNASSSHIPIPSLTVAVIDTNLSQVYAQWDHSRKILSVKGPSDALLAAASWFGPQLFLQSSETEFTQFLKLSRSSENASDIRKVLWTPHTVFVSQILINILNEKGSRAFADASATSVPFIEIYLPGLLSPRRAVLLNAKAPLLKQLLEFNGQKTDLPGTESDYHRPSANWDLVTLYRWPSST